MLSSQIPKTIATGDWETITVGLSRVESLLRVGDPQQVAKPFGLRKRNLGWSLDQGELVLGAATNCE